MAETSQYALTIARATELGTEAGKAAASWVFDGNTSDDTYYAYLRMSDAGDPALYDTYRSPDLSGEWADGPTPTSLARDLGMNPETDDAMAAADAWEDAAEEAFYGTLESIARQHVTPEEI